MISRKMKIKMLDERRLSTHKYMTGSIPIAAHTAQKQTDDEKRGGRGTMNR
jgi:hypothetical protein